MTSAVRMLGITRAFPGVVANRAVDFELAEGEVHGLLGENGAGKTTLMNILYGLYQPDAGTIKLADRVVSIASPRDALALGIGMVHQHFQLVPRFSVAENFQLGALSGQGLLLEDRGKLEQRISEFATRYRLSVDPSRPVWQLSVGEQQRVEILRALYRKAHVLILDEPTAVLTPQEIDQLACILEALTAEGKSVVLITHKLEEVVRMTHRVTVMRDGSVVGTALTSETNRAELAHMMVGRDIKWGPQGRIATHGKVAMQMESISACDSRGLGALKDLSLEVRAGEILGIAGVDGNGQSELEEVCLGLRPVTGGRVKIDDKDVTNQSADLRRRAGMAYIPSDRYLRGIVRDFSVAENLILGQHTKEVFVHHGFLDLGRIARHSSDLVDEYRIRTPSISSPAGKLSGGNAQRLILARELSTRPSVVIACQPTRGLDVGATESVRNRLLEERERGAGVLLISADLDEIMSLSDRIAVLCAGRIVGIVPAGQADQIRLGLMMAGSQTDAAIGSVCAEGGAN